MHKALCISGHTTAYFHRRLLFFCVLLKPLNQVFSLAPAFGSASLTLHFCGIYQFSIYFFLPSKQTSNQQSSFSFSLLYCLFFVTQKYSHTHTNGQPWAVDVLNSLFLCLFAWNWKFPISFAFNFNFYFHFNLIASSSSFRSLTRLTQWLLLGELCVIILHVHTHSHT